MMAPFTDEQIIQMITEQEIGERTADVCRRYWIVQGTFQIQVEAWRYGAIGCKEVSRVGI